MSATGLLVYLDHQAGRLTHGSLEALSEGARMSAALALKLNVLMVDGDADVWRTNLAAFGVERIYACETGAPQGLRAKAQARAMGLAAARCDARVLLFPGTATAREVASRASALLGVPLTGDCVDWQVEADGLAVTRPVFGGRLNARVSSSARPQLIALRAGAQPVTQLNAVGPATIERFAVESPGVRRLRARQSIEGAQGDLAEARLVLAGGRGLGTPQGMSLIKEVAAALHGAMAASRAVVAAGLADHTFQVGQTGRTIAPDIYIACGISGAIQHIVGMSSSKTIVAINNDAHAAIFQIADYGLVGDSYEILSCLRSELRRQAPPLPR